MGLRSPAARRVKADSRAGLLAAGFPLLAIAAGALALFWPAPFVALRPGIPALLGLVMLGMGMTLRPADFGAVLRRPGDVALGAALQFGVMPAAGWALATGLGLPPQLVAGVVLVGACPGGTASNVVCFLARGDVALSITLTTVSTLLAVAATPVLTWVYAGERVPVPVLEMLRSIATIVVGPVAVGVSVNALLGDRLARTRASFPILSVLAIVVIIAIVVALNRERAAHVLGPVAAVVALHNLLGLGLGYGATHLLTGDETRARTLAIEVGMQNSGLAVALASTHFSALATLPGALFSIWHNLSGAALAGFWSRRPPSAV